MSAPTTNPCCGWSDWIKSWGLPRRPLPDDWRNYKAGLLTQRATFPRKPSVRPGDRLFYYAVGHRVLFAVYEATSLPFHAEGDDGYDWHLLVSVRQKPSIRLRPAEAEAAEEELQARITTEGGKNGG